MHSSTDRRRFLGRAALMLPLMHAAPILAMSSAEKPRSTNRRARLARLRLKTGVDLDEMSGFYGDVLGLQTDRRADGLSVTAGETIIDFTAVHDQTKPYYHFAFNIPHNKIDGAIAWMHGRAPLIKREGGGVVFHFPRWDAHAIYFLDPAGNILELIARHTLKNDASGDFTTRDILCASEIGVVAPDVVRTADQLCDAVKVERYHGGSDAFTAVGDELGLFIVVKTGRVWFTSDRAAEVFPAEADVRDASLREWRSPPSDFRIAGVQE